MSNYPVIKTVQQRVEEIDLYSQIKYECGARGVQPLIARVEKSLTAALNALRHMPNAPTFEARHPNGLRAIRALRPPGPRQIWRSFDSVAYRDRLEGALLCRFAGCTLGALVEGWPVATMEAWAKEIGDHFPPTDYWTLTPNPHHKRYAASRCDAYTRDKMDGVPVDDDIVYTLLGLLIIEEYGPQFSTADVGQAWLKHLPHACTAERVALDNLKRKIPARQAATKDNPYIQWIGADIRSDPWAYVAPGWPEQAAKMAYRDAYLSHRYNGIYGEMFFAAAQSAAFALDDPLEAIRIGLTEIPAQCDLAQDVRWALKVGPRIRDYKQARAAVDRRFAGMNIVHTNNNACLSIFGLMMGGRDVTRVLSETVAMGLDNDCTAATVGSIVGALVGRKGVPKHWTRRFNNKVHSYLLRKSEYRINDLLARFARQAARVFQSASISASVKET
jgi:ADP-ribosylglycohydrolase